MKKLISVIAALIMCASLTACNGSSNKFAGLQLLTEDVDRGSIRDLEELEQKCDIAFVGEYLDDGVQETNSMYMEQFDTDFVTSVLTTASVKVTRVLLGDINVGDEVKVKLRYGIVKDQLITGTALTPMQKGDEWVFFLTLSMDGTFYWHTYDSDGRYPTKNSSNNGIMPLAESPELGVYNKADFNEKIYNELVEKYGI